MALVSLVMGARKRDLGGGFFVRRVLPQAQRRLIGPFIFFDHMGPTALPLGEGMDVRPHPHIALATVTYLFDGEIDHRDSLDSVQTIRPGDVNWMIAGKGIVHSERSSPESRKAGVHLHGIQTWVALPLGQEESEPRFEHHAQSTLPHIEKDGVTLDVVLGTAYGKESPVLVLSPTLYVHAWLDANASLDIDETHEERAVYVVEGAIELGGERYEESTMVILEPGAHATVRAQDRTRLMILGGAKLEGERHIYWNFVSSSPERIEKAKDDWKNDRFPHVSGDPERIPLPDT